MRRETFLAFSQGSLPREARASPRFDQEIGGIGKVDNETGRRKKMVFVDLARSKLDV